MISREEIAVAKAVPIADIVSSAIALKGDYALCCFHEERSASFHIHRATNTFCCFGCGAKGDGIEFVRRFKGLDFAAAIRDLIGGWQPDGTRPQPLRHKTQTAPHPPEVPSLVSELWRTAAACELVRFYLESRNLAQKAPPSALKGHPRVWCKDVGEYRPAMLAAVSDAAGRITAIQRTWLQYVIEYDGASEFPKGARCPDLSAGKKCLGPLGAGAVRLAAAGEVLGIAEGVESALAAATLFRVPVWATCGLARCGAPAHHDKRGRRIAERSPTIWIPPSVQRLVFFGDNGEIGHLVADYACSWWRRHGLAAQAEYPDNQYGDFADQIRG